MPTTEKMLNYNLLALCLKSSLQSSSTAVLKKICTELPLPYHISTSRLDFTNKEKYIFCLHWRFQFLMLEVNSGLGNSASPLLYNQIVLHWRSYNTVMTRVMMACKICRTRLRPLTQKRIWLSIISSRADHSVFGGRRSISFRIHILGSYSSGKLPSKHSGWLRLALDKILFLNDADCYIFLNSR